MEVLIDNVPYEVLVVKKNNKNLYIRVKEDLKIHVTCNFFTTEKQILKLINDNEESLKKMIDKQKKKIQKKQKFYYLGVPYNICLINTVNYPKIIDDTIYTKTLTSLENFSRKECERVFFERFEYVFSKFKGRIPKPCLRIRKMRQKWGHCNKKECVVTLNSELIQYSTDEIDYVLTHELCHLIHFNHSREFWYEVECYKPDYKKNKKVLREE